MKLVAACALTLFVGASCANSEPDGDRGLYPLPADAGRGESAASGGRGGSISVVDDEPGGACPFTVGPAEYGGAAGEGGGGQSCAKPAVYYAVTSGLAHMLCGCSPSREVGVNLICYPPPPDGGACDDRYSKACISNDYGCADSHRGGTIVCGTGSDPVTGADACCYLLEGACVFIDP